MNDMNDIKRRECDNNLKVLRKGVAALGCAAIIGAGALPAMASLPLAPPADMPAIVRTPKKMPVTAAPSPARVGSTPMKAGGGKRSRSRRGEDASDVQTGSHKRAADQADLGNLRVQDVKRPWGAERQFGERISDSADLITAESRQYITSTIRKAEEETGTEMYVVTLPSVGKQSPKKFATMLFNEWKIGKADPNNGILVLVVKDQRRIEIEA